ncbi:hypothetical protein ACFWPP_28935 [Streptomyces anulatus]|uniref:hypothetical protein n=1 Tax=Streptomyces TaxID=1883 RepID=UPI001F51D20F|nr:MULTISPECIES: hypothetical protein [unclassified Streptomyces]
MGLMVTLSASVAVVSRSRGEYDEDATAHKTRASKKTARKAPAMKTTKKAAAKKRSAS